MGLLSEGTNTLKKLAGGQEIKNWVATADGSLDAKWVPFQGTREQAEAMINYLQQTMRAMAEVDALPPECKSMRFCAEGYTDGDDHEKVPTPVFATAAVGGNSELPPAERIAVKDDAKIKIRILLTSPDSSKITHKLMHELQSFLEPVFRIIMLPPDGNGGAMRREGDMLIITKDNAEDAKGHKAMLDYLAAFVPNNKLEITCKDNQVFLPPSLLKSIIEIEEGPIHVPTR